jgi:S-DNA-T family DNA segregation ATPase FtsK/SpoIIIE
MTREGTRKTGLRDTSVPLFSMLVPLGFAVIMWWATASPAMMLFALMGPVAMVASLADARRQGRVAQRVATEDAERVQGENERNRALDDEREAARARRQHASLADLLENSHHRPVGRAFGASTLAPVHFRLGLDPGRRPVLIPLDAHVCVVGSPEATARVARTVRLTMAWIGGGAGEGSVCEACDRAAIPANTSLVLTLVEQGWAELSDVRTPLDAVAVLIDEVSEAQASRARRECETSRALRHAPPQLGELIEMMAVDMLASDAPGADTSDQRPADSHVRGILGWADAPTGPQPVWVELSDEVPHMLVAGATGSGKTETLVALLASMAAAHPPERFRFAVIDFKGGGGFARVASLAHNDGITTDLDGDDVLRALAGIRTEMARRETLLRDAGRTDIAALAEGLRVPRLLMVIDEFRALCEVVPDARRIVADVASRGRALGMHLAVATQRAAGAFGDDLLVNAQMRLCLAPVAEDDARYLLGASVSLLPVGVAATTRLLHIRRPSGQLESVHPVCVDANTLEAAGRWTRMAPADGGRLWWPELPRDLSEAAVREHVTARAAPDASVPLGLRQDTSTTRWSVLDYVPHRDGALWVKGGPQAGKTTLLQNIVQSATHLQNMDDRDTPAGQGEDGSWTVLKVPTNPALAWDALITASRAGDHRSTHRPELIIVDGLDAIARATPDDALDDLVAALERVAREGPGQGRFLVFSTSNDEPSLSAVTRNVRFRIDLGSRYPGRGSVGGSVSGDAVQLTRPSLPTLEPTGRLFGEDRNPLPTLSEVLRDRRAVVLTNAPEVWQAVQASHAAPLLLDALTPDQALTLSDEMRRRVRLEPLVWHGVARMSARFVGRDVHRIPPPLVGSVVVLEADDSYVRATLPGT